jgi:hypothetical protein
MLAGVDRQQGARTVRLVRRRDIDDVDAGVGGQRLG